MYVCMSELVVICAYMVAAWYYSGHTREESSPAGKGDGSPVADHTTITAVVHGSFGE